MKKSEEVFSMKLLPNHKRPGIVKPGEQSFNFPSAFVAPNIVVGLNRAQIQIYFQYRSELYTKKRLTP